MRVAEYGSFMSKLQRDVQFARGFLTHCYHVGFIVGNIKHPDEIEFLSNQLVIKISSALLPVYYMETFPDPCRWMH